MPQTDDQEMTRDARFTPEHPLVLGVVTATRAEYGLLRRLLFLAQEDPAIELRLYVTGTHLSHRHGHTVDEILGDGFQPYASIPIIGDEADDSPLAINERCARALLGFAQSFASDPPDALLYLGDRYEILPISQAALNARIPTIHLCGGETSEGASDELVRHALTKLSTLHFPEAEPYRKRILQLGEHPSHVWNMGSPGVENVLRLPDADLSDFPFDTQKPFFLVTFHPETLRGPEESLRDFEALLDALSDRPETIVFTGANADVGGVHIQEALERWADEPERRDRVFVYDSLGVRRYLTLMRRAAAVVGNSSSGIIEAPACGVPTVNIGGRQDGRLRQPSILDAPAETEAIREALERVTDPGWLGGLDYRPEGPDPKRVSELILRTIKEAFREGPPSLRKTFVDL